MIMADVFAWFFIILGLYLALNGYWLVSYALFPAFVGRCRDRYVERPVRSLLLGVAVLLPILVIGGGLSKAPNPAGALGKVMLLLPILAGIVGSTGLVSRVGEGLVSKVDADQPWRRVLRGGLALAFTFLLPFIGWFLVMPGVLIAGFGAALASRRARLAPAPLVGATPPADVPLPPSAPLAVSGSALRS